MAFFEALQKPTNSACHHIISKWGTHGATYSLGCFMMCFSLIVDDIELVFLYIKKTSCAIERHGASTFFHAGYNYTEGCCLSASNFFGYALKCLSYESSI